MKSISTNPILFSFLFLQLSYILLAEDRKLSYEINPGCNISECNKTSPNNETFLNLVHIRADSSNDTIHYLFSSIKSFSLLVVKTDLKSSLTVNWNELINPTSSGQAISFSGPYSVFSSLDVNKVYEYDDEDDTANPNDVDSNHTSIYNLTDFLWQIAEVIETSDSITVTFPSSYESEILPNNTLRFKTTVFSSSGRPKQAPRLKHNANDVQLEVFLDDVPYRNDSSRFALEFALVTDQSNSKENQIKRSKSKTLDDEYTPGVFSTVTLASPKQHTYLQWKPVVYTDTKRTVESLTSARDYDVTNNLVPSEELKHSLVYKFLTNGIDSNLYGFFNVSFGEQKDDFYSDAKFQTWVMLMGSGTPPSDSVSLTVILVLTIGLGFPVIFVIFGSGFILYRKVKKGKGKEAEAADSSNGQ